MLELAKTCFVQDNLIKTTKVDYSEISRLPFSIVEISIELEH